MQVVLHLLRMMRVELDLLRGPATIGASPLPQPGTSGAILFVSATAELDAGDLESGSGLEQRLRAHIEHSYARQGIARVEYELQIV